MAKKKKPTSPNLDLPLFDPGRLAAPPEDSPPASAHEGRGAGRRGSRAARAVGRRTGRSGSIPVPSALAPAAAAKESASAESPGSAELLESNNGTPLRPLTVSQLARGLSDVLDISFPSVWVVGQVSGLKIAPSGHTYFDLKDEAACLGCIMWRDQARKLREAPQEGLEVLATGHMGFFPKAGRCQLYVTHLEPRGVGSLEMRFRRLKEQLEREGLFAAARKKALPAFPATIGVVTSPTGAAVRDIIHVLKRRWPPIRIVLYPVRVQGSGAAEEIARAVRDFNRHLADEVDVLIIGRGGGSADELWAFNEEIVARAIAESGIPTVSAVGHETDFSISDFVADVRAPTPSAAAEIVVPDRWAVLQQLSSGASRLHRALKHSWAQAANRCRLLGQHRFFKYPREIVGLRSATLDQQSARLEASARIMIERQRRRLEKVRGRLVERRPAARLALQAGRLQAQAARFEAAGRQRLDRAAAAARQLAAKLEALSPLAVLDRGYSITLATETGRPVRAANEVHEGETLETIVANRQRITSRVTAADSGQTDNESGRNDNSSHHADNRNDRRGADHVKAE